MNETNLISSGTDDHKYFTLIPRIVIATCDDPFELNLWVVIKEIAGEKGECYVSTPRLAVLANQSVATVYRKRNSLIEKGLIHGVKIEDPQTKVEIWHLSIPDLWDANLTFARGFPKIDDRVEAKKDKKAREYLSQSKVLPITVTYKEEPVEEPLQLINNREVDSKKNVKTNGRQGDTLDVKPSPRPPIALAPLPPIDDPIPIGISGEEYLRRLRSDHKHQEYLLAEYHRLTQREA